MPQQPDDSNWETSIAVHRSTVMLIEHDKRKNETMEDVIVRWHNEKKV